MSGYLTKRNGAWQFTRRVPSIFAAFDKRGIIKLSTKIRVADDRSGRKAARIAERMSLDLEAFWRKCSDGAADQAAIDYAGAVARARALGFEYAAASAIAQASPTELVRRIDTLAQGERIHDAGARIALLGAVTRPPIPLTRLFDEFEAVTVTQRLNYSEGQLRKWRNGKRRAAEEFVRILGPDKTLNDLLRSDVNTYRDHWSDRVQRDGIAVRTANKNIGHVSRMVKVVSKRHQLDKENIFAGARLEGGRDGRRRPFATPFIIGTILREGALDGLNAQARAAVHVMVNTGARPSEIVNLTAARIRLDAEVPYIRIAPVDRIVKSESSERDLPVVGVAFDALRRFPNGFPRYADNEDSLSATVNKYFRENGMKPSKMHTLYSLRHSFKDRLREVECPDELRDELMGHHSGKPVYGDGHGLRIKLKYLEMIAIAPGEKPNILRAAG